MARILVIYAGGTIGCAPTAQGLEPLPYGQFEKDFRARIIGPDMPAYDFVEMPNPIDSSRANIADWVTIATLIDQYRGAYNGFVVLHGTDTMAHAAAALSFSLMNIDRPVVLTGAHVPLRSNMQDPRENAYYAMQVAARNRMPGVSLWFGDRLMAGTRAVKVDCENHNAFDSPNAPYLATLNHARYITYTPGVHRPSGAYKFMPFQERNVVPLEVPPGSNGSKFLSAVLRNVPLDGVVLKAFGNGNIAYDETLAKTLTNIQANGTIVTLCTQCLHGSADSRYAAGSWLGRLGVIAAGDMTGTTAVMKLKFLLNQDMSAKRRASAFLRNQCNEMTAPHMAPPKPITLKR